MEQKSYSRIQRSHVKLSSFFLSLDTPTTREEDLKILAMLAAIKAFNKNKKALVDIYEKNALTKRSGFSGHFSGTKQKIYAVEPLPKSIANLQLSSKFFFILESKCRKRLLAKLRGIQSKKQIGTSIRNIPNESEVIQVAKPVKRKVRLATTSVAGESWIQKTERLIQENKKKHKRFNSDASVFSTVRSSQFKESLLKKREEYFITKKKQEIKFLKKINVDFVSNQSISKAFVENVQIFFRNIAKSNYLLEASGCRSLKCQQMLIYIRQLNKNFQQIFCLIKNICHYAKHSIVDLKNKELPLQLMWQDQFEQYQALSKQIMQLFKELFLIPNFETKICGIRKEVSLLTDHLTTSRYLLRYLQKQIDNRVTDKRPARSLNRWQQAYRLKFQPKHSTIR